MQGTKEEQMSQIHNLKIEQRYFESVYTNNKTFELRKNDRDYQVNDILFLREFKDNKWTGREVVREITYVLDNCLDFGLQDGYCILGIKPVKYIDDDLVEVDK